MLRRVPPCNLFNYNFTWTGRRLVWEEGHRYDNTPIAAPLKDIGNKADLLNNQVALAQPHINNLSIVQAIGSLAAGGEAAAAEGAISGVMRVAGGTIKNAAIETSLNAEGKAVMGILSANQKLSESFANGKYLIAEATEDMTMARIYGGSSPKEGSFFGFVPASSSADAERMYFLDYYGNKATQMTTVTIKKGTQFAVGMVENGTGVQVFLPKDLQSGKVIYSNVTTALK